MWKLHGITNLDWLVGPNGCHTRFPHLWGPTRN